jgi:NAD(P)-dependent dehydrogenase (short-subunit alcohol dehydrogenase family)
MKGKRVLITGATRGIGEVCAVELAKLGADLTLVARAPERGQETEAAIRAAAPDASVETLYADLSSMAAIRALADEFKRKHDRLDVLVNNAGGIFAHRKQTVDGFDWTFAVNHLAYFLLTNLLLDVLKASAPSRVVSTSSGAHAGGRAHFDDLQGRQGPFSFRAYQNSKLFNILFTRELARRLADTKVTANCHHPGFVRTGFGRNEPGLLNIGVRIGQLFALSPEAGARTMIYLASSPEVAGISGEYFYKGKVARTTRYGRDMDAARRLWEVSAEMTGVS